MRGSSADMTGTRTTYKGTRPGGRSARVRAAVIAAAAVELLEHGYDGFSLPRVAERAGVALTTLHRRWGSKARLVADVLVEQTMATVPVPDTGTLETDLRTLAGWIAASLDSPELRTVLRSAFALPDEELADVQASFWPSRFEVAQIVIDRAIARGELPAGTEGWSVVERINAPIWMRKLITGLPVDDAMLDKVVDDAITLARLRSSPPAARRAT